MDNNHFDESSRKISELEYINHKLLLEINKLKEEASSLILSEEKYRVVFEQSSDSIFTGDNIGNFIGVNRKCTELTGFTTEELLSMNMINLFSLQQMTNSPLRYDLLAQGHTITIKRLLTKKDKTLIPIEMTSKRMSTGNYQCIMRDLSENNNTSDILKASEQKFLAIFNASPIGIFVADKNGFLTEINDTYVRIVGGNPIYKANFIGKLNILNFQTFKDGGLDSFFKELYEFGKPFSIETKIKSMFDKDIYMHYVAVPLLADDGTVNGCIVNSEEITQRKLAELKLSESEEKFKAIMSVTPDIISIIDKNQKLVYNSPIAISIHGYTYTELNNDFLFAIHPDDIPILQNEIKKIIASPESKTRIQFRHHKKGTNDYIWMETIICNYVNNPLIQCYIAITRDISKSKKDELELIKAKEEAIESDKLKSVFLANMSHEIRTPMNGILGFSQLLGENDIDADSKKKYIEIIQSSTNHLLTVVNDIVDISKIEVGQISLEITQINIHKLLNNIYEIAQNEKKVRNKAELNIYYDNISEQFNLKINSDETRLQQVIINLITNAIKFTDKGSINFGYKISDKNIITFYVKDTGKGIEKSKQAVIFERFRQEEETVYRKFGGTGLGLAISKGLVELFGGKMWVESELNEGSIFYFTIPFNFN
ncbi:MAG: hypothetical protein A2033_19420 [Bacteroidetes bacterium GWA2_31_9]|nr:MAG: hypothetical protein A2033_19420 [Bacteroidetes bacterium GWA2_31_9]